MGISDSRLAENLRREEMEYTSRRVINWHLLELTSDSQDEHDCFLCCELRVGPTFHCSKCNSLLHKSCIEVLQTQDMKNFEHVMLLGDDEVKELHHMISTQVLDDEEKVVCSACHESVLGSAYRCFTPNCHFLLHASCANLPPEFDKHPAHPKHKLYAKDPSEHARCVLCSRLCDKGLFYQCFDCKFTIDIKCACSFQIKADNCSPHKFFPIQKSIPQFTCQACGLQKEDLAYLCKRCGLWIHDDCAQKYLGTIKVRGYRHFLTCTFSLHPGDPKCRVCSLSVDTRYAAYLCHKCGYIVHLWCANEMKELGAGIEFGASSSDCGKTDTASPLVIEKHESHPEHNLILCNEQPSDDQRCVGCMNQIIFPSFYCCEECSFSLHERCAQLPKQILQPLFHQEPLALYMALHLRPTFICDACDVVRPGFHYCEGEGRFYDIDCALLPEVLKHEGHQHYLLSNERRDVQCSACGVKHRYTFRCTTCVFYLCYGCATYPLKVRHRFDEHLLKLSYQAEDNSAEYYCLICEQKRNSNYWFYHCIECNFTCHPKCILSYKLGERGRIRR